MFKNVNWKKVLRDVAALIAAILTGAYGSNALGFVL